MNKLILFILGVSFMCGLYGQEDMECILQEITAIAQDYIKINSTEKEETKWLKKWKDRMEQALSEREYLNENSYTDEVVMDWLFSRRNFALEELGKQDKITFFRYFLLYKNHNLEFPEKVREYMTVENLTKFIDILKVEIKK